MGKLYRLIDAERINPLIIQKRNFHYGVAVFHWLIPELYRELGTALEGVEIEIVKVIFKEISAYPSLGLHFTATKTDKEEDMLVEQVEAIIERLLQEKPLIELITFITAEKTDWKALTDQIMSHK